MKGYIIMENEIYSKDVKMFNIIDKLIKGFCYPIHLVTLLTNNIKIKEYRQITNISLWFISVGLVTMFVNEWAATFLLFYLYLAGLFHNAAYTETENNELCATDYDKALTALTQDYRHPPVFISFTSHVIPFSSALENSISWLSIEKKHSIYVFGIGKEIIVIPEYFGNEISEYVIEAVNGDGNFDDVECFRIKRNDIRNLACRFVPNGDSDYKIEYLRITENNIEVIGVDE